MPSGRHGWRNASRAAWDSAAACGAALPITPRSPYCRFIQYRGNGMRTVFSRNVLLLGTLMISVPAAAETVAPLPAAHDAQHARPVRAEAFDKQVAAPAAKRKTGPSTAFLRQRQAAMALGDDGDAAAADRALAAVIAHPDFGLLGTADQRFVLSRAGMMALRVDDQARARGLLERATASGSSNPDDWYFLAQLARQRKDHDDATRYLLRLVHGWPHLLDNLQVGAVLPIVHETKQDPAARLELMQALFDSGWDNRGLGLDDVWYELALLRVERGEPEAARRLFNRISAPTTLVRLRADKRFDALVDPAAAAFDVEAAAERRVGHLRQLAETRGNLLEPRAELGNALLMLGRHEEALAVLDEALARLRAAPADAPAFEDMDQHVWLLNNRAIALRRLGRIDDAVAELTAASRMTEDGLPNVSQALNLGQFFCQLGRPAEARAVIAPAVDLSGYGRMVKAHVELCAARQAGDAAAARRALAYLRKHRDDSAAIWIEGLVEADQMDAAARALADAVAATETRGDILAWLQQYRQMPPLPGYAPVHARWRALMARADVQRAFARVGRIQRYDIFFGYGTE